MPAGSQCGSQSKIQNRTSKISYTPAMPIPRLRINEAALLVIDMQERLMPTIADADKITHNAATLLRIAEVIGMPYLITEQYPTGLGRTVEAITAAMEDQSRRIEKTSFSAAVDIVLEQLHAWRRSSIIICGIEAHVCVLQTVLDLHAAGRQGFVCLDAISSSQREQVPWALRRMERAGAIITGAMSAVYELLGDSTHPAFKPCLELIKSLKL
jgi:nicotinamidase-related amidase